MVDVITTDVSARPAISLGPLAPGGHRFDLGSKGFLIRFGRSLALAFCGEGIQSVFHFALNLVLIRALSTRDYGIFAIVFTTGIIALSYGNAAITIPAIAKLARPRRSRAVRFQEVLAGSIVAVFALLAGTTLAIGFVVAIHDLPTAVAAGSFVGLWLIRNHLRIILMTVRKTTAATLSDVCYAISGGVLGIPAVLFAGAAWGAAPALLSLTLSNLLGIGVALYALGPRLRVSARRRIVARYRMNLPQVTWSVVGTTAWNIQGQALTFIVAAIAGPVAYAPIGAAMLLFAPLRTALTAFMNVFRPELVIALAERRDQWLRVATLAVSLIVVIAFLGIGFAIWLSWPLLDRHVFANKFEGASLPLVVALAGLGAMTSSAYNIWLTLLQAAGAFRAIAVATWLGAIVGFVSVCALVGTAPIAWSIAGMVIGEATCGTYLWLAVRRLLKGSDLGQSANLKFAT